MRFEQSVIPPTRTNDQLRLSEMRIFCNDETSIAEGGP
jgi:hypothetical protein